MILTLKSFYSLRKVWFEEAVVETSSLLPTELDPSSVVETKKPSSQKPPTPPPVDMALRFCSFEPFMSGKLSMVMLEKHWFFCEASMMPSIAVADSFFSVWTTSLFREACC